MGGGIALYVCVEKGKGVLDLYDLVTVEHKHQEHDAIEILQVVLALGGHGQPPPIQNCDSEILIWIAGHTR
jgi:hypothetical protein